MRPDIAVATAPAIANTESMSEPNVSPWPSTLTKNNGINAISPYSTIDRHESTPIARAKFPQRSGFASFCVVEFLAIPSERKRLLNASRTIAQMVVGKRKASVPCMPKAVRKTAAISGPTKKPMLPPTAKMDMPFALRAPAARFDRRPPSGWNIATPMPDTMAEASTVQ